MKFTAEKIKDIVWEKLSLRVKSITEDSKGYDQNVWILDTNKQKIVFKHPKDNNKIRNTREKIACELLAKKGIIVPQILYVDDNILIETFLEGPLVEEIDFSEVNRYDVYFKMGLVMKRIHSIKTTNFGHITDETLVGEFPTQIDYLELGTGEELHELAKTPFYTQDDVKRVMQYFERNKSVVKNSPSVLLHMDFCDSNVIYTPKGEIAVIDFGDLSAGNPMYDVTKVYMDHIDDGAFQAFTNGYGEIQLEQVKLFALGWLIWLIPFLMKNSKNHARVKRLCKVFESIWK